MFKDIRVHTGNHLHPGLLQCSIAGSSIGDIRAHNVGQCGRVPGACKDSRLAGISQECEFACQASKKSIIQLDTATIGTARVNKENNATDRGSWDGQDYYHKVEIVGTHAEPAKTWTGQ